MIKFLGEYFEPKEKRRGGTIDFNAVDRLCDGLWQATKEILEK